MFIEGRNGYDKKPEYISSLSVNIEDHDNLIRIDDSNNLAFWMQITLTEDEILKLTELVSLEKLHSAVFHRRYIKTDTKIGE